MDAKRNRKIKKNEEIKERLGFFQGVYLKSVARKLAITRRSLNERLSGILGS